MPSLHIPPRTPPEGIVLNVPARRVFVFHANHLIADYPVAVGKPDWQTALGTFHLAEKQVNPKWTPTRHMVKAENIKDDPVPPGRENPLGDRWMGWSKAGFGFHSTNQPRSVGRVISHGCVRLYPDAAHQMFEQVKVGMPIYSVYAPVLIGARDGQFYLCVFPDVYHKGLVSLAQIQKQLKEYGLLPLVEEGKLRAIEQRQDGYPHRIVGSETRLEVNGQTLSLPIAPVSVAGRWFVPVKPVVAALGGATAAAENAGLKITNRDHTLVLTAGQRSAQQDGQKITLPGEPTVVEGNWIAPLAPLVTLFDLRVDDSAPNLLRLLPQSPAPTAPKTSPMSPPSQGGGTKSSVPPSQGGTNPRPPHTRGRT